MGVSTTRVNARLAAASMLAAWAQVASAQDGGCLTAAPCPGVELSAGYVADFRRNTRGGLETGGAASNLLDVGATLTTRRIPGVLAVSSLSVIRTGGDGISARYVGDLQGLNNIEAPPAWRLYEAWTELRFGPGAELSTRAGYLDLNAEFDTAVTSAFFVGSPFGIGTDIAQTGNNGPAVFPVTSLGVRLAGPLGGAARWRAALFDGVPGRADRDDFMIVDVSREQGALAIAELELEPAGFHKIALGAWSYTAAFEPVDGGAARRGNRGLYAMADRPLGTLGETRFDGVLRAGVANGRFNAIESYVGAALVASRLFDSRPEDAVGVAVAHGRSGSPYRRALTAAGGLAGSAETAVELTYRAPLASWLAVAPSAQWVQAPGADRGLRDAFVVGLRFEMAFGHAWPLLARDNPSTDDSAVAMTAP